MHLSMVLDLAELISLRLSGLTLELQLSNLLAKPGLVSTAEIWLLNSALYRS